MAGGSASTGEAPNAPAQPARKPSAPLGIGREPSATGKTAGVPVRSAPQGGSTATAARLLAARLAGTLPFTGLDLALYLALGLALALGGLRLRTYGAR